MGEEKNSIHEVKFTSPESDGITAVRVGDTFTITIFGEDGINMSMILGREDYLRWTGAAYNLATDEK